MGDYVMNFFFFESALPLYLEERVFRRSFLLDPDRSGSGRKINPNQNFLPVPEEGTVLKA